MVSITEIWVQQDNPTTLRPQLQQITARTFTMQLSNKKFTSNITTKVLYIMFWNTKTYFTVQISADHNACYLYVMSSHHNSRQSSLFTRTHTHTCARTRTHISFWLRQELQNTHHITCITIEVFSNKQLGKKKVLYHVQKYQNLLLISWAYRIYLRNLICDFVQNTGLWPSFIRGRMMATCSLLLHVAVSAITMTCTAVCTVHAFT